MSEGIKLSPKYGVNPTIPICFFCGAEKNEVALLGRIGDGRKGQDIEAPRCAVLDYTPCPACQSNMSKGVALIEATQTPNVEGQPPISRGLYPTGRWGVVSHEFAERMFSVEVRDRALIDPEVYGMVFRRADTAASE